MFQGGFQCFDIERLWAQPACARLPLPMDQNGRYDRQVFTNNGRTATVYVLDNCFPSKAGVMLLPDYLCLSVLAAVEAAKIPYRFYHITRELSIDMESLLRAMGPDVLGLYIIEYFGMPYEADVVKAILNIKSQWGIPIVEDITQALLTAGPQGHIGFGDYVVASTRKWFPVTDGGLAAAREDAPFPLVSLGDPYNEAAYKQLLISLVRRSYEERPGEDARAYLPFEREANKARYTDLSVRAMTPQAKNIMLSSDIGGMIKARRENYAHLYQALSGVRGITLVSKPLAAGCVPFGLTVLVERRDAFYEYLMERGVIGEIQWLLPTEYYTPGADALYLSAHNLMFQCDQRYTLMDMDAVANKAELFFSKSR